MPASREHKWVRTEAEEAAYRKPNDALLPFICGGFKKLAKEEQIDASIMWREDIDDEGHHGHNRLPASGLQPAIAGFAREQRKMQRSSGRLLLQCRS